MIKKPLATTRKSKRDSSGGDIEVKRADPASAGHRRGRGRRRRDAPLSRGFPGTHPSGTTRPLEDETAAARQCASAGTQTALLILPDDKFTAGPPGMAALPEPLLRPFAQRRVKAADAVVEAMPYGKCTVLISRLDIVSGLFGTGTWGIKGYESKWSEAFMQNALLWTSDGQPDAGPPRPPPPRSPAIILRSRQGR